MPLVNLPLLYPAVLAQPQRAQESEREQGQRALQALFEWQREGYTWHAVPASTSRPVNVCRCPPSTGGPPTTLNARGRALWGDHQPGNPTTEG